jgi:hypothetical protein
MHWEEKDFTKSYSDKIKQIGLNENSFLKKFLYKLYIMYLFRLYNSLN